MTLSAPASGTVIKQGKSLALRADAADADGSVVKVLFFSGATMLGVDETAPYEMEWAAATEGEHLLTAVAVDNRGAETISEVVSVTVLPPNTAPEVVITGPSAGQGVSVGGDTKSERKRNRQRRHRSVGGNLGRRRELGQAERSAV